jgi:hypothetical protein
MYLILNGYRDTAVCPDLTPLDFCLWGWMKSEIYKRKVDTQTNCSHACWMLLPAYRNVKINSDEQHAIFAYELQSALRLTVGFSNIYCEL